MTDRKHGVEAAVNAQSPVEWARDIVGRNRRGEALGFFSVCSAHPMVLKAAMRQAVEDGSYLSIESTSNQVNQYGGYTGLTPAQFADKILALADEFGLPRHRVLLGGDHLGPYPWRSLAAEPAMENAVRLVRDCVLAGYKKIHLDASMACSDDPRVVPEDVVAQRAALLCRAAEDAEAQVSGSASQLYVIGTEVPVPGGEQAGEGALHVTKTEDAIATVEVTRRAFESRCLQNAWERVIGLVVQPGVEFGDETVAQYDREKARHLSRSLPKSPELVYEAHSTDYQTPLALRSLVEDHFAILKVGPWLTFAMREAIFALGAIECDWLGASRGIRLSNVREALEQAMLRNPEHWKSYYTGDEAELRFARMFSFSDRCRYYWGDQRVETELGLLMRNLSAAPIPLTILSQYLPQQYEKVRAGMLEASPDVLIQDRIRTVLRTYSSATGSRRS